MDATNTRTAVARIDLCAIARTLSPRCSAAKAHTCATRADGTLWCWDYYGNGQVGTGDIVDQMSPVQVGAATDWTAVALGDLHTCATRADKTAWCWGNNARGQLETGDTTERRNATQLSGIEANAVFTGSAADLTFFLR